MLMGIRTVAEFQDLQYTIFNYLKHLFSHFFLFSASLLAKRWGSVLEREREWEREDAEGERQGEIESEGG